MLKCPLSKKTLAVTATLLTAVLAVAACGTSTNTEPVSDKAVSSDTAIASLPADAQLAISLRVHDTLADPQVRDLIGTLGTSRSGKRATGVLDTATKDLGIDPTDIDRTVVFTSRLSGLSVHDEGHSALGSLGYSANALVVGRVNFDQAKIVASLNASDYGPLQQATAYRGVSISQSGDGDFGIAFLAPNLMVLGKPDGIHDVIDVRTRAKPALSGDLADRLSGDSLLRLVATVPSRAFGKAFQGATPVGSSANPLGGALGSLVDASAFTGIKTVSANVDKAGAEFLYQATIAYDDAQTAQRGQALFSGLVNLYRGFTGSALGGLLNKVKVVANGSDVVVTARYNTADLNQVTGAVKALSALSGLRQGAPGMPMTPPKPAGPPPSVAPPKR
ncbi:MAG: hypothetical protein HY261_02410 [Chloroflexi bacterium]|nr:hypothetical protein [Chloroflexota bacterium]